MFPTSRQFAARIALPRTSRRSEGRQRAPAQEMPRALGFPLSRRCSAPPGIACRASPGSTRTTMRGSGSLPRGRQPPRVPRGSSPPRPPPIARRSCESAPSSLYPPCRACPSPNPKSNLSQSRQGPNGSAIRQLGDLATRRLGNGVWPEPAFALLAPQFRNPLIAQSPDCPVAAYRAHVGRHGYLSWGIHDASSNHFCRSSSRSPLFNIVVTKFCAQLRSSGSVGSIAIPIGS